MINSLLMRIVNHVSSTEYRRAVGSLIYAMICTRPDLSWIVTKLSQYSNNPTYMSIGQLLSVCLDILSIVLIIVYVLENPHVD